MIDMVYRNMRGFELLAAGTHRGVPYWIVSYGTHPCSYIDATALSPEVIAGFDPHGGITYDEDYLHNVWDKAFEDFNPKAKRIIGWDYVHAGDYDGFGPHEGHQWTTKELLEDLKAALNDAIDSTVKDQ